MIIKRFTLINLNEQHISANIYDNGTFIASISLGEELIVELLNSLNDENEQLKQENKELKAKVDDKEVAVEVECEKLMQKVFDLIDEKVDELEKRYKFGQEVYKGCPMHNIRFGINTLKELKKELQND